MHDGHKQNCLDFLLGAKEEQSRTKYFEDNIAKGVIEEVKYCTYEETGIYFLTWNCSNVDPLKLSLKEKEKLFFLPEGMDVVVICLQ